MSIFTSCTSSWSIREDQSQAYPDCRSRKTNRFGRNGLRGLHSSHLFGSWRHKEIKIAPVNPKSSTPTPPLHIVPPNRFDIIIHSFTAGIGINYIQKSDVLKMDVLNI